MADEGDAGHLIENACYADGSAITTVKDCDGVEDRLFGMDVHAPHEPVHTWKDFAIHLTIVTIGLFIALMLEAGVEYWHHRHIVAEARENIREEIKENHDAAQKNVGYVQQSIEGVKENVKTLHVLMKRPKDFHGSLANTIRFESFHNAAWRTARDTGALSHMPYEEVKRYSDLYMMEEMVTQKAVDTAERSFRASSPVFMGYEVDSLPEPEYMDMLRGNATSQLDLTVLSQYVQQFDKHCMEELKR